jgi:hypothetical protein
VARNRNLFCPFRLGLEWARRLDSFTATMETAAVAALEAPTKTRARATKKALPTRRLDVKPAAELSRRQLDAWLVDSGFATVNGHGLQITKLGLEVASALNG